MIAILASSTAMSKVVTDKRRSCASVQKHVSHNTMHVMKHGTTHHSWQLSQWLLTGFFRNFDDLRHETQKMARLCRPSNSTGTHTLVSHIKQSVFEATLFSETEGML
jgi:hypothetical protein